MTYDGRATDRQLAYLEDLLVQTGHPRGLYTLFSAGGRAWGLTMRERSGSLRRTTASRIIDQLKAELEGPDADVIPLRRA